MGGQNDTPIINNQRYNNEALNVSALSSINKISNASEYNLQKKYNNNNNFKMQPH